MAFPVIQTTNETANTSEVTSHPFNLPSGIVAGDLIVILCNKGRYATTFNALTGWSEVIDENSANGNAVMCHWADGTEGATVTFTCATAIRSAAIAYRISGAANPSTQAPEISTVATGTSVNPNATVCTPTGGADDYLWITWFGATGEQADSDTWVTVTPTNYGSLLQKACGTAGSSLGGIIAAASRTNNAASEDAGAFTQGTSRAWRAYTLAVHQPAAGQVNISPSVGATAAMAVSVTYPTIIPDVIMAPPRVGPW